VIREIGGKSQCVGREKASTSRRSVHRIKAAQFSFTRPPVAPKRARCIAPHRNALLLGTALVSTLLLGTIGAPAPALAVVTCAGNVGTGPTPISRLTQPDSIVCVNTEARTAIGAEAAIDLSTTGDDFSIVLDSEGRLQATNAGLANGIRATTVGARSGITIESRGDIGGVTGSRAYGILAFTLGNDSPISITHRGDIAVSSGASDGYGISAQSLGAGSPLMIDSGGGRIEVSSGGGDALGVYARTFGPDSNIAIVNSADIGATSATEEAWGIRAQIRTSATGTTSIRNTGDITATARRDATGLSIVHSFRSLCACPGRHQ